MGFPKQDKRWRNASFDVDEARRSNLASVLKQIVFKVLFFMSLRDKITLISL